MVKIPIEIAEKIYEVYSATLVSPVPFKEMFTSEDDVIMVDEKIRNVYERGILKPKDQVFWLRNLHAKNADFEEPYDLGIANALELFMSIITGQEPTFKKKLKSGLKELKALKKKAKAAEKAHKKEQEENLAKITTLETQLKSRDEEIAKLKK